MILREKVVGANKFKLLDAGMEKVEPDATPWFQALKTNDGRLVTIIEEV